MAVQVAARGDSMAKPGWVINPSGEGDGGELTDSEADILGVWIESYSQLWATQSPHHLLGSCGLPGW